MSALEFSENRIYNDKKRKWEKARDCVAGQDRIKERNKRYLSPLPRQTDEQYKEYLEYARFYNTTKRTVEGLTGLVFRKPVSYDFPSEMGSFVQDVSLEQQELNDYCQMVHEEVLTVGRGGTLVDYPRTQGSRLTVAEAEMLNQRPYWSYYTAEQILDWRFQPINGVPQPVYIRLLELVDNGDLSLGGDRYTKQYRELELIPVQGRMEYRVTVSSVDEDVTLFSFFPERGARGERLSFIPFIFHGPKNYGMHVEDPPIDSLCDSNISHYRMKADHYHGLRYAANPQYWIAGVNEDEIPSTVGTSKIWAFAVSETRAGILEYSGKGLEELRLEEESLESQMAIQGVRLLGTPQGYNETATSAAIRNIGETATLGKVTKALSGQMTRISRITAWWEGHIDDILDEGVWIRLNMDFKAALMDSQMILALVNSWQERAISRETLFYNLKHGEVIPAERSFEEERASIQSNPPPITEGSNGGGQIRGERAPTVS